MDNLTACVATRHLVGKDGENHEIHPRYEISMKRAGALSIHPESLFSIASVYDFGQKGSLQYQIGDPSLVADEEASDFEGRFNVTRDLTSKELSKLIDELCSDVDDNSSNDYVVPDPAPLNIPSCYTVAEFSDRTSSSCLSLSSSRITLSDVCSMPTRRVSPQAMLPIVCGKRSNDDFMEDDEDDLNKEGRFRPYQADQWSKRFSDLVDYRNCYGDCLVPHTYTRNLPLARWVKRQRYQYKLMKEGKVSTMTEDRVKALEEIDFIWNSQGTAWSDKLEELREFKRAHSHCNVPSSYAENPQLATWVKCQRRQYKLYSKGQRSNMTQERIQELESIDFEWLVRPDDKKAKTSC